MRSIRAPGAGAGSRGLPTPRHGLGAVAYGGRIFVFAGGPQPGLFYSRPVEADDCERRSREHGIPTCSTSKPSGIRGPCHGAGLQLIPAGRTTRLVDEGGRLVAPGDASIGDEVVFGLIDSRRR